MTVDGTSPDRPEDHTPVVDSPLVGATFRVTAIEGVPTLAHPAAELAFGHDGRLSGCATVNRIMGTYTLDGDTLALGPLAGTMMAGPPEAMAQEQRLHATLPRCTRVEIGGPDGAVVLRGDDGTALVALEYAQLEL